MKERFRRFMMGRHGVDDFGRFLNGAGLVLIFLGMVLSLFQATYWVGTVCMGIAWFCMIWTLVRAFSKNHSRRYAENNWYLQKKYKLTNWWRAKRNRFAQRKTHRFYRCPQCSVTTRVPRGKGKVRITCPRCGNVFVRKS